MKIALIGNCQINPLGKILKLLLPDIELPVLPVIHQVNAAIYGKIEACLADADYVIGQLVADSYHIEHLRTSILRERFGERLIVWPNMYFSSYAPEYGVIRDADYHNFIGPLFEYHSEKIVLAFLKGLSVKDTVRFITEPSTFDERRYGKSVENNLGELRKREMNADIVISDYIEKHFSSRRLFFIFNHPSAAVLVELALRILKRIGATVDIEPKAWMVADMEMNYVFHGENPFIRLQYNFEFPETFLSRGSRLVRTASVLGYANSEAVFYTPWQLVEAYFLLYNNHRERLSKHPRFETLYNQEEKTRLI